MPIIEAKNLTKRFGDLTAVNKVNLKVNEGEIFGLLGPNGAGKTTTLSMLSTLIKPSSGSAKVNGFDIVTHALDVRKSIGFVFQDPSSDDLLSGRENLYLHALMYGVDMNNINKKIDNVLRLVDLAERQNSQVKTYSGGMRRRLELARGLLHEPKVLFLDEPTLGLDPQTREHLWTYIKRLSKEKHVTIIVTTHYMEEADLLCDRVAIIDRGKIIALDTPTNLKKKLGGDIVRFKIKSPNIARLRKLKYVHKIDKVDDGIVLTVDNADRHLQELLKIVGDVESVESHSPTLNDVFIKYTGKEIRDTEAEGGWYERAIGTRNR